MKLQYQTQENNFPNKDSVNPLQQQRPKIGGGGLKTAQMHSQENPVYKDRCSRKRTVRRVAKKENEHELVIDQPKR